MNGPQRLVRGDAPALFWQLHQPETTARGGVLLVHGYQDHSGHYLQVVEDWTARGLAVARLDLRGHGRSEGKRGYIRRFEEYLRDVEDVLEVLVARRDGALFARPAVFAQSMGALVACQLVRSRPGRIRGLALGSPYFALAMPVPPIKRALANLLGRWWPSFGLPAGIGVELLTRDPEMQRTIREDELKFRQARAGWFLAARRAQEELAAHAAEVTVPVYCRAGADDRLADVERTKVVVGAMPRAELRVIPGCRHDLCHELDRAEHVARFGERLSSWFDDGTPDGSSPAADDHAKPLR